MVPAPTYARDLHPQKQLQSYINHAEQNEQMPLAMLFHLSSLDDRARARRETCHIWCCPSVSLSSPVKTATPTHSPALKMRCQALLWGENMSQPLYFPSSATLPRLRPWPFRAVAETSAGRRNENPKLSALCAPTPRDARRNPRSIYLRTANRRSHNIVRTHI